MLSLAILATSFLMTGPASADMGCPPSANSTSLAGARQDAFAIQNSSLFPTLKCHRLSEGESTNVNWPAANSPTKVVHSYRLTRISDKEYLSEVRLDLKPERDVTEEQVAGLKVRLMKCLKEQSPNLRGPNGETLTIRLSDDPKVPASPIAVSSGAIRENSMNYSLRTSCPTLIHETLHLHGLCDEYHEQTMGFEVDPKTGQFKYIENAAGKTKAFDCRHLGPETSIMRNEWAAVVESQDWQMWSYQACKGAACEDRISASYIGQDFIAPKLGAGETLGGRTPKKTEIKKRTRDSILEPGQFNAITRPGCREENDLYYKCSANAYISSTEPPNPFTGMMSGSAPSAPARGTDSPSACRPTPAECREPGRWLADQPKK